MSLLIPDSADAGFEQMQRSYDQAHDAYMNGLDWCDECHDYKPGVRPVRINGASVERCHDCRPFDRPCEACGNAEALPEADGCLSCEIEFDLEWVQQELAAMEGGTR